jgi:hypothetical protein
VIAVVYVIAMAVESKNLKDNNPLLNSSAMVLSLVNTAASSSEPKDIDNTIAKKYLKYALFCKKTGKRK